MKMSNRKKTKNQIAEEEFIPKAFQKEKQTIKENNIKTKKASSKRNKHKKENSSKKYS